MKLRFHARAALEYAAAGACLPLYVGAALAATTGALALVGMQVVALAATLACDAVDPPAGSR